jgi:hypothetical protein
MLAPLKIRFKVLAGMSTLDDLVEVVMQEDPERGRLLPAAINATAGDVDNMSIAPLIVRLRVSDVLREQLCTAIYRRNRTARAR